MESSSARILVNILLIVRVFLLGLIAFVPFNAFGQSYPNKPIRLIVPYVAGGATDVLAREVALRLQSELGQPVVLENKPGAGGVLGADLVSKSAPDGYTLLLSTQGIHVINPTLFNSLPYDPVKDLAPVSFLGAISSVLVVNSASPIRSMIELISYAKANPGKLNFASSGNGLAPHLSGEMFRVMAGIDVVHIPYNGSPPAMLAVLNGDASYMFQILPTALTYIKSGKIRALAITSPKRSILLPDVPTVAESGLPKFEWLAWFGISVPAGTSKEIIAKLNMAIVKALKTPEVEERLLSQGIEPLASSPEQFSEYIKAETLRWNNFVKVSGFKKNF
jgi:tripartite-type tricarboxylate transporter receptor subunit TctC